MTLQERLQIFINLYLNKTGIGNTDLNKGQCVGLVSVWMDSFKIPHEWGNAKDLLANADKNFFDVIYNNPNDLNQFPVPGDVMVFDSSWGNGDGHTGVVVKANGSSFSLFEQNDVRPDDKNGACEVLDHNTYAGVLGWLHIKNTVPPEDTQKIINDLRTARDTNYNLYQSEITKNAELSTQIQNLQVQTTELEGQVNTLKQSYFDEQKHTIELNSELEIADTQMAQIKAESKDYGIQILDAQHKLDEANQTIAKLQSQQGKQTQSIVKWLINLILRGKT